MCACVCVRACVCGVRTDVVVPLGVEVGLMCETALHHIHAVVVAGRQVGQPPAVRTVLHFHNRLAARRRRLQLKYTGNVGVSHVCWGTASAWPVRRGA